MRKLCVIAVLIALSGTGSWSAEEVDRLLAAVNGKVITEGDFKMARPLYALFYLGKIAEKASRQEELVGLIELELDRQELENFPVESGDQSIIEETVQAKMNDLREAYAEIGGLPALLRQLSLQEDELVSYVRLRVLIDRFLDMRFRPFATPSDDEVEAYYREKLTPQLKARGAAVPPLMEVSAKIKEILTEEKVNTSYDQWIENIKTHSRIEIFPDAASSSGEKRP